MATTTPVLTVHRATQEIGGNCIELACDGHRIILDAGRRLSDEGELGSDSLPPSLNLDLPADALILSHPHQDHCGLLRALPAHWPVWSGPSAEVLIRLTASLGGDRIPQSFRSYQHAKPFEAGPFKIAAYLTDHSAFDSYMLLVDCAGKRILYSGDFRRVGRKAALVNRFMERPPKDIDILLLEGTTLGRIEAFPTEAELEEQFVALFQDTAGRVFVTWSAQNVDRTVTIYRACKRTGRTLVLDLYTIDVLERLSAFYANLPRLGWPNLRAVITQSMKRMYEDSRRMNAPEFVQRVAQSGKAMGGARLREMDDVVVMLRPSLLRDLTAKGLGLDRQDSWVFSMWSGYMNTPEYQRLHADFAASGANLAQIHTSGHACRHDLQEFARKVAPRHLVPIHSFTWDQHLQGFENVTRLRDGETFTIL
jgi:ribonuclease J